MSSYLNKCLELHKQGQEIKSIIENIYINYSSSKDNDKIYEYKKIISQQFNVSLKDIKLIGSAHTKFSKKNGLLEDKDEHNDYDFAIINTSLFNNYWSILNNDKKEVSKATHKSNLFYENLKKGKIHPFHLNQNGKIYNNIKERLSELNNQNEKQSSICIYAFEDAFINNLCEYLTYDLTQYFKNKTKEPKIKELTSNGFYPLEDIGEKINGK